MTFPPHSGRGEALVIHSCYYQQLVSKFFSKQYNFQFSKISFVKSSLLVLFIKNIIIACSNLSYSCVLSRDVFNNNYYPRDVVLLNMV